MKILHSTDDWLVLTKSWIYDQVRFMPDGVEQGVWCDRLVDGPHTSWNGEVFVQKHGIYSKVASTLNSHLVQFMPRPKGVVNFKNYDVIISHFGFRAWHDYFYVRGLPLKKVVRFYGFDIGITPYQPGWMAKYQRIFQEYNLLLCEGPYMAKELEKLGAPKDKIKWVYIGIDPNLVAVKLISIAELINPLHILVAGTFTEKKGIEYALEGVLQFARETGTSIKLTLVGDSSPTLRKDCCRKEAIEKNIREIKLEKNIQFVRKKYVPLKKLYSIMKKNLVFIAPSIRSASGDMEGGFPVTLTHAAANGMILIGTDHCDLPEIVRDRFNGYTCQQRSPESISMCLKKITTSDIDSLCKKRIKSIELVLENFNAKLCEKTIYDYIVKSLS